MSASTLSTTSHPTPTLPTEIIEEILKVEVLSKQDLARCCLVSRRFLPPSRKQLYDHLELLFGPQESDPFALASSVLPVRQTLDLYHTLHRNASLCCLSTTLSFKPTRSVPGIRFWPSQSIRAWIEKFLALTPNLKHFFLDHFLSPLSTEVACVPPSILENQNIVSLGLRHLTYDQLAIISRLPNLRMLRFSSLGVDDDTVSTLHPDRPILPNLRALDTYRAYNGLPASFSHALRVFRIDLDRHFIDFSLTPELAHLYLKVQTYTYRIKYSPDLSPLLRLRYLHLDSNWADNNGDDGASNLYELTKSLPSQSIVLAMTYFVSSSTIARRLNLQVPLPIRELHLSPSQDSHADDSGLDILYTTCVKKEVKLSFDLADEIDIFRL